MDASFIWMRRVARGCPKPPLDILCSLCCVFPSITGTVRSTNKQAMVGANDKEIWVGDEALAMKGLLKYPFRTVND